jgi:ferredoxin
VSGELRVFVAAEKCLGHARCVALAPAVFALDEDAERSDVLTEAVPPAEHEAVLRAYQSCPEGAITLAET